MFKRPFTSKSSTLLRQSDLRKLRDELSREFHLPLDLVKSILPDGVFTTSIISHLDEKVVVFSSGGNPLFFRIGIKGDAALIPTCYTCDLLPTLLPSLLTAKEVVEHLISGAALFSAGVSDRSLNALPSSMLEGSLVSVVAQGSAEVVAIGQLAASKQELVADRKGKAVLTIHARGDFLWKSGDETVASPLNMASGVASSSVEELTVAAEAVSLEPEVSTTEGSEVLSPSDVDAILRTALLFAIQTTLGKNPSLFPLAASSLYSGYILPFRPAHYSSVDIKKSSYKKLAPFLKVASKASWIVTKEIKGELTVMRVNPTHPEVQSVRSYKTCGQLAIQQNKETTSIAASAASAPSVIVKELYKPSSSVLPLFQASAMPRPKDDLYLPADLKTLLLAYIETHSLSHPRDLKFILLDPLLSECLLKKGEVLDVMTKDDALKRLKEECGKWYSVSRAGSDPIIKKGSPPLIKVSTKTVGKRMVTLISNFEIWDLFRADDLAEELKHKAASSSAVQPLVGSHEKLVVKSLIERGVPKAYIEVDNSKAKR